VGDLDALLSPLDLGPVRLASRIVSTSHQTSLVHDHLPTEDLAAYHAERARGGVALIVMEATAVHPTGLLTAHTLGGYLPDIVAGYRRVAEAVQPHGTRLFAQFLHSGREMITAGARPPTVSASAVPSQRFGSEPRALSRAEIRELVEGFGAAARFARDGGLDGVEVCAGFGYLPTQFLSSHVNRRRDAYGGAFENRVRFLRELLEAMRAGVGESRAVGARLSLDELSHEGTDPDDVLAAVRTLCADGLLDYVSVTLGGSPQYLASTYIVPPPPVERAVIGPAARRVKEVAAVPVIATSRIVDPAEGDALIRRGDCDAVGMTRALIADPDMPRKARAGGRITRCIGCNQGCIGHYHAGLPIACTVNPWAGYERVLRRPASADAARTVVVVGAGPAGCAAAAAAAAEGHRVVLFERRPAIGGQMRLAAVNPGHAEVALLLAADLEAWLGGVEVRLEVAADADAVVAERPDAVVVATGAAEHRPDLHGEGVTTITAWEALEDLDRAGGRVVVHDWGNGWTGVDAAEALAAAGRSVRLVIASAAFGEGIHQYQRNLYLQRLDDAGVELVHHLRPVALCPGAVAFEHVFSGREMVLTDVDTLVVSAGRVPVDDLFLALEERGVDAVRVGDALGPRGLEEAIREGTLAGLGVSGRAAAAA
jgi:2,4-dienoyl-CoA reductase-like NADH-dependent reductase (Old Yellow Enzyme family)/thioredoxin reductase